MKNIAKKYFLVLILLFVPLLLATAITNEQLQKAQIINVDGLTVKATFSNLSEKAIKQGLNKVYLEGKIEEKGTSALGISTISINWVRLADKISDNKVYLETPLQTTDLKVKPALETGDNILVKGDIDSLVSKQQELIIKNTETSSEEEEAKAEKEKEEFSSKGSSEGYQPSNSSNSSGDDTETAFDKEIEGNTSIVVTSDGCDIVANIPALEANQYKKVLENGEVVQDCSPSEVSFALTKDYTTCSPFENLDQLKAFQRYNLGYIKEEGGSRTVVDGGYCHIDEATGVNISENDCGNEIDSINAKYYKKTSLTYNLDSRSYVAQSCVRKEETALPMKKDKTTCSASFEGGYFTPFFNWYVEEEGKYTSLSECLPDVDEKIELEEELCTGDSKYTFDNDNKRAYLNKTFFYLKDDNRITVNTCEPSDVVYTYETNIDGATCPFVNNDETKETTQRGYNFFNGLDDELIEIKDRCVSVFPAIPYLATGSKWKAFSSEEKEIGNNSDFQEIKMSIGDYSAGGKVALSYHNGQGDRPCWANNQMRFRNNEDIFDKKRICFIMNWEHIYTAKWNKYCMQGMSEPYNILNTSNAVDIENSDEKPLFQALYSTGANSGTVLYSNSSGHNLDFKCTVPKCNLTTMEARPTYTRGDNTEFIDMDTTLKTKYICGVGSKLEDTVVQ